MSIERRGRGWRVRYRDEGGRNRSRAFALRKDAQVFAREVGRRKQLGELALLDLGRQPLNEFLVEWLQRYGRPNLSAKTLRDYAAIYDRYIEPRLGTLPLRAITPAVVERVSGDLRSAGVGGPTLLKLLTLLSGMFNKAELWGYVVRNPIGPVAKPPQRRSRVIRPLSPVFVEGIRSHLLASSRVGDATLVSLLAYAGLRPGEALALRRRDISNRTILVEKAVSLGSVKDTKTRASRSVKLLSPLAADLREWRFASGVPGEEALLFPAHDGREFSEDDWRNWRRRVFLPAAAMIGLTGARPYDLRHSFVSLLIAEGTNVIEVARQAGHSPTMTLDTYGHVFEEATGAEHGSAEEAIWAARVPAAYPTLEVIEEI